MIIDHTRDHFYNKWPCLQLVDTEGSTVYQQSEGRLWGQVIGDTAGEKHVHPIEAFAIGWVVTCDAISMLTNLSHFWHF